MESLTSVLYNSYFDTHIKKIRSLAPFLENPTTRFDLHIEKRDNSTSDFYNLISRAQYATTVEMKWYFRIVVCVRTPPTSTRSGLPAHAE